MIRSFVRDDAHPVVALWHRCGLIRPWNDPFRDIERTLSAGQDLFLVAEEDETIVGAAMGGYDGHRGWVNYLAVSPDRRGAGIGRALMAELERRLVELGCPKLNLQIRADNAAAVEFYSRLGYTVDQVVSMGRRLIPDS